MASRATDITADGFTGFCLEDDSPEHEIGDMVPEWAQPMLTTVDAWDNYSDDLTYELDKRIRSWIATMRSRWTKRGLDRRYSFKELTEILGVDEEARLRDKHLRIARVLAYYSTKIQKRTVVNGVRKKSVYTISPARLKKPPYSLRLRLELMEDENPRKLRLPKDNLEIGHARHPRTNANMQRRSEEGRRRYNEYQAERRARVGRKD